MAGNILFALTALFCAGLVYTASIPVPGGGSGIGYVILLIFWSGGFAFFSLLLTLNLSWNNAFDWLGNTRHLWVGVGWLTFVGATVACSWWNTALGSNLLSLRPFARHLGVLLPLLLLLPALSLLNLDRQAGTAPLFVKIPMAAGAVLSVLIAGVMLAGWFKSQE